MVSVAEFIRLSPNADFAESKLESTIIGNLQRFLFELGIGFRPGTGNGNQLGLSQSSQEVCFLKIFLYMGGWKIVPFVLLWRIL